MKNLSSFLALESFYEILREDIGVYFLSSNGYGSSSEHDMSKNIKSGLCTSCM